MYKVIFKRFMSFFRDDKLFYKGRRYTDTNYWVQIMDYEQ